MVTSSHKEIKVFSCHNAVMNKTGILGRRRKGKWISGSLLSWVSQNGHSCLFKNREKTIIFLPSKGRGDVLVEVPLLAHHLCWSIPEWTVQPNQLLTLPSLTSGHTPAALRLNPELFSLWDLLLLPLPNLDTSFMLSYCLCVTSQ